MQRLLNLLVGVGLVISALAMFAVSARFFFYLGVQDASALGVVFLGVVPVVAGLLTLAALHLSHEFKGALLTSFVAIYAAFFGAELYLQLKPLERVTVAQNAMNLGNKFDPRTPREFALDLRKELGAAVPAGLGRHILEFDRKGSLTSPIQVDGREFLPFAGPALTPAVLCNVSGQWIWYWADEQGFNNPRGLWAELPAQVLMVGDSFVHGICVPSGETMADHIRRSLPKTINLGLSGSGPITTLALLREFGPVVKPPLVLWFFYSNDVTDLEIEKKSPLLMKYLHSDASGLQDLYARKSESDKVLHAFMKGLIDREPTRAPVEGRKLSYSDMVFLRTLRHRLGIHAGGAKFDFATIRKALETAKGVVGQWGGEMVLVYLPAGPLFESNRSMVSYLRTINDEVKRIAEDLQIERIDVTPHFASHAKPLDLFDRAEGHYNTKGYAVAAKAVIDQIKQR